MKMRSDAMKNETLAVILEEPERLSVKPVPMPEVPEDGVLVQMRACGICGSDVRYYYGENPWALHTLGQNKRSPRNMILGHEVSGVIEQDGRERRVGILAYKGCGRCRYCLSGRENVCEDVQHIGHSTGWGELEYFPGGMSERFLVWPAFEYDLPERISFDEATFLDGLAVAVHAVEQADPQLDVPGGRFAVLGLGPVGNLCAQTAKARGAETVRGCDTYELPLELAEKTGLPGMVKADAAVFASHMKQRGERFDAVIDTVGTPETVEAGLSILDKLGSLILLSVHEKPFDFSLTSLNAERRIFTSANNRYGNFPQAIELLSSGAVTTAPLITHRFPLSQAKEAFDLMLHKENQAAFKIILHPDS
jgi:2-desacetyl-2-hydroxyethyl bacteriochlorophyllide A dehydrogenase